MPSLTLDPRRVRPFAAQPRKRFRGIPALAQSIKAVGQVTPIVVTAIPNPNGDGFTHELVDGERRLKACLSIDRPVKAVLDDEQTEASRFALSIAANFCRQEHDCIEISDAIWTLKAEGRTPQEIATIFGKSISWVSQYASLANLAPELREQLKREADAKQTKRQSRRRGRMTPSLALCLVPLEHKAQLSAARVILAKTMSLAAARNHIYRMAAGGENKKVLQAGSKLGRSTSPRERWERLENATDLYVNTIERYVTMPRNELDEVLVFGFASGKKLAEQIERLCEDLLPLAKAIRAKAKA